MSDDWKPGDLALTVKVGPFHCPHGWMFGGVNVPPHGAVREVSGIHLQGNERQGRPEETCGCLSLSFTDGSTGNHHRFRKIRPHTPDEEDRETIRLLTGKPVKEPT